MIILRPGTDNGGTFSRRQIHKGKRRIFPTLPKPVCVALTVMAAIVVGVGIAWVVATTAGKAGSEQPNPNVPDFSQRPLTPFAVPTGPVPTPLTDAQRSLEPPPGDLPTPSTRARNAATAGTANVPEGWRVYDNPKFQYTFALPPDWQTDMPPDGGQQVQIPRRWGRREERLFPAESGECLWGACAWQLAREPSTTCRSLILRSALSPERFGRDKRGGQRFWRR